MTAGGRLDLAVPTLARNVTTSTLPTPSTTTPPTTLPAANPQPVRFLANNVSISVSSPATVPPVDQSTPRPAPTFPVAPRDTTYPTPLNTKEQGVSNTPSPAVPSAPRDDVVRAPRAARRLERLALRRLFTSWRGHAKQRHYKRLASAKDEQIVYLLSKMEEASSKRIVFCQRARGRRLLAHWRAYVGERQAQRNAEHTASALAARTLQAHVLHAWQDETHRAARERASNSRAWSHHATTLLRRAMTYWAIHAAAAARRNREAKARRLHLTLCAWRYTSRMQANEATAQCIAQMRRDTTISSAVDVWRRAVARSKDLEAIDRLQEERVERRRLAATWQAWRNSTYDRVASRLLDQAVFSIETIRELFADNTRLAKLLDTSIGITEQVAQLRASSDVNEALLRRILALIERPLGVSSRKHSGSAIMEDRKNCPEVFRRLAAGGKRDLPERRECQDCQEYREPDAERASGTVETTERGENIVSPTRSRVKFSSGRLSACLTTTVCVGDGEFFSVAKELTRAFERLGWCQK